MTLRTVTKNRMPTIATRVKGRVRALAAIAVFGLALALGPGCALFAPSAPPPPPEADAPPEGPYVIGAADVIQVRVWKNEELSVEVPVRPDGNISVPLLDDVRAEGLTAEELKEVIATELTEYIANPDVTVVVSQMLSKRVYVIGEVARSGPFVLITEMRITDAISQAGGFGPFADKKKVRLIRRGASGETEYGFDYDAYVRGSAPGTNIVLHPGDTIVVPD